MAGESARAESLARDLDRHFPLDTQVQSLWLPTIRAQLELNRKNPAAAIDRLETPSRIDLGQIQFINNISCLYPVLVMVKIFSSREDFHAAAGVNWDTEERSALRIAVMALRPALVS
jgi:hypothetical protein